MVLATGGYPLPKSLEDTLETLLRERGVDHLSIVQCYGAAEVDAACLIGMERNERGEVIYHPRDETIAVTVSEGNLFLAIREDSDAAEGPPLPTGDQAVSHGEGYVIRSDPGRYSSAVLAELERWGLEDWSRRTGYLGFRESDILFQLREGITMGTPSEIRFFPFLDQFKGGWLNKPIWSVSR